MLMEAKTPQESDTTITELMIPAYANFGGKIHGGILLSLMDKVAYACATRHAGNYCVTVAVDSVHFLQPVEVGDLVSMMARINHVGTTSLVVGIKVTAENVKKKVVKHTNTSYFTMVAKDDDNQPAIVPPLCLTTADEVRRFADSMLRKKLKTYEKQEMAKSRADFDLKEELKVLKEARCVIELE